MNKGCHVHAMCKMLLFWAKIGKTSAYFLRFDIKLKKSHAGAGASSTSVGPFPGNWLAARIADLTPDLQVLLSWGSTVVSFHSRQSLSVSLGLPAPCLPSICISHTVLIAPLERSKCPNQQSFLSLKMRLRSSSFANNSLDLTVATSSGLILQICLIIALSLRCKRCRFVLVCGQVSLAWSMALRTQELYTWPRVL